MDDLLQFVIGPTPYSSGWLWLAIALSALLIVWYAGVFVLTLPRKQFDRLPVVGAARSELLRRRFAREVRAAAARYRAGELGTANAAAVVSSALRGFLHQITGARAEYMHVDAIANSELAPAAPVLAELVDAQFNAGSTVDVAAVSEDAEELIRTWS